MDSALSALVMCGGNGTRLRPEIAAEKPLVSLNGRPMIDHVLAALRESTVETIYAAVSPATPETAAWLESTADVTVLHTAGEGYVADLVTALETVGKPVLTVTADLPLMTAEHVDRLIRTAEGRSVSVCVPLSVAEGVVDSVETTVDDEGSTVVPTGLSVVGKSDQQYVVWDDRRLALNVNRPADCQMADRWLSDSA